MQYGSTSPLRRYTYRVGRRCAIPYRRNEAMTRVIPMTYAASGVDYATLDAFKREAQKAAAETANAVHARFGEGYYEVPWTRGESAHLFSTPAGTFAVVEEGLGTKELVAAECYDGFIHDPQHYFNLAQCTVAMIVNDMITLGALPMVVNMHLAVGDSAWFTNSARNKALIDGWRHACDLAGCTWGGGETPTLKGVVHPKAIVLSGSAVGKVMDQKFLIKPSRIQDNDCIYLVDSSGIHANGLTLARAIADKLPKGYLTKLPSGASYGNELLKPTHIYVPLIERLQQRGVDIHYAVNITGHGFRKLMRAPQKWQYTVDWLPNKMEIFNFIATHGPVETREMYSNYNMGAGFAIYISEQDVELMEEVLEEIRDTYGYDGSMCGRVSASDRKRVVIRPLCIAFEEDALQVR